MTSADFAVRACDSQFLLGPLPRLTQRLALKRTSAAGKALGAVSLGAAFVLGSGEAFAGPKTMMHDGESFFNVGDLNSKQLQTGAMEITLTMARPSSFQPVSTASTKAICTSPRTTCPTSWRTPCCRRSRSRATSSPRRQPLTVFRRSRPRRRFRQALAMPFHLSQPTSKPS